MNRAISRVAGAALVAAASISLSGCLLDRVQTVQEQACQFDKNFTLSVDNGLGITSHNPVLLLQDLAFLAGLEPRQQELKNGRLQASYTIRKVGGHGELEIPIILGFRALGDEYVFTDAHVQTPFPTAPYLSQTALLADNACNTEIPLWRTSMEVPIPEFDHRLIPSRDQVISVAGSPLESGPAGNELLYKFVVEGEDDDSLSGSVKLVYDQSGEKLLHTYMKFSRYTSVTDFEKGTIRGSISL